MTTGPTDGRCANTAGGPGGMPWRLRLSDKLGNKFALHQVGSATLQKLPRLIAPVLADKFEVAHFLQVVKYNVLPHLNNARQMYGCGLFLNAYRKQDLLLFGSQVLLRVFLLGLRMLRLYGSQLCLNLCHTRIGVLQCDCVDRAFVGDFAKMNQDENQCCY